MKKDKIMKKNDIEIFVELSNVFPDAPNLNGRIYTKEVLKEVVEQINEGHVYFHSSPPDINGFSLETVAGTVSNAVLKEDGIYVEIKSLHTPKSFVLDMLADTIHDKSAPMGVTMVGKGTINEQTKEIGPGYKLVALYPVPMEPAERKDENKEQKS